MYLIISVIKLEEISYRKSMFTVTTSAYNSAVRNLVNKISIKNFKFIFRDFL